MAREKVVKIPSLSQYSKLVNKKKSVENDKDL